jgi:LPS export ABC transporter protein LptC
MRLPSHISFRVVITLCFLVLVASCSNDLDEVKMVTSRANVNIETGKEVEINYSDNGIVRIKAVAATAIRHNTEKPYLEFSDGIKLYFYKENNEIESMMTAEYATAVENSNEMIARKNVEVINAKGEKLNTEELIWDEQRKIIYSNTDVKITTADEIIFGKGMTANQNFTDYVIKNITGTIKVKADELP